MRTSSVKFRIRSGDSDLLSRGFGVGMKFGNESKLTFKLSMEREPNQY